MFTDDPVRDAEQHMAEQDEELNRLPICCHCTEHIQQDRAVCIDDNWYCDDCLEMHYTQDVEDYDGP